MGIVNVHIPSTTNKMTDTQATSGMAVSSERSRIIILVDETGSMHRHKPVTLSSYNEWLDQNRTKEEDEDTFPKFSLVKFNTTTRMQEFESVETAPRLTNENYTPNNMTALYDAIGDTLTGYQNEKDNIMVIITDGEENSSRKYRLADVNKLIKQFTEEKGWIFHYLGANQDAWKVGASIGISDKKFCNSYAADDDGFEHVFAQNVAQTKAYRGHQARKKKGMFVPRMEDMAVPQLSQSEFQAQKAARMPQVQNIDLVEDAVESANTIAPVISMPVQKMKMKKTKKVFARQQMQMPQQQQMRMPQQQQMQMPQQQMVAPNPFQNAIDQSNVNRVQIQQDFNQLYNNSDADMQQALKNSLNENF